MTKIEEPYYLTSGKEEFDIRFSSFKGKARLKLLDLLSFNIEQRFEKYFSKPRAIITILCLHNTFEDELENLAEILEFFSRYYTFISYSKAVDLIQTNSIDKPYMTFTSDDGYRNNLKGVDILAKFDAFCCFFVCSEVIGETDYSKIRSFCREKFNGLPNEFMNWSELNYLKEMGHEIGGHTYSHINLAATQEEEIYKNLSKNSVILTKKLGEIKHFAWTYGKFKHFSPTAKKIVFELGYISCASAERGSHVNAASILKKENLCIRREAVHLSWPINHIKYFVYNGVKNATPDNNLFV